VVRNFGFLIEKNTENEFERSTEIKMSKTKKSVFARSTTIERRFKPNLADRRELFAVRHRVARVGAAVRRIALSPARIRQ